MATLYELTDQLLEIYNMDVDDETKLDTLEAIDWTTDYENKVEGYVKVIKSLEADIEARKNEKKRLDGLNKSDQSKIDKLKTALAVSMAETGQTRVDTTLFKVGFRKSEAVVVNEEKLPKEYQIATYKPDKKTLKELLKSGKHIEGATLEERRNLNIR
ncbi:Mu Gam-like end protection [Streptococcus phage 01205]|uniref:ORF8 n=1 Tax=Streptococcus phage O1205 TaxID=85154 RepID=O34039_BPO12|nr:Mu Gam-like end protection [Streptococcus phage 01205]AAC79524.1 ORF8 [Streptococcus phage 01205]